MGSRTPTTAPPSWSARQTRAKCLTDGECDAVPLGQPDDIVFVAKGYTKLGDSLEVIPVLQFNVIAARRDWAAKNKDLVVRFARAFGDAYRFMRDPKNRDEVTRDPCRNHRRAAGRRARDARVLLRARPRRDAAAGGDQPAGRRQGDRAARRDRRAQGAAALPPTASSICNISRPRDCSRNTVMTYRYADILSLDGAILLTN